MSCKTLSLLLYDWHMGLALMLSPIVALPPACEVLPGPGRRNQRNRHEGPDASENSTAAVRYQNRRGRVRLSDALRTQHPGRRVYTFWSRHRRAASSIDTLPARQICTTEFHTGMHAVPTADGKLRHGSKLVRGETMICVGDQVRMARAALRLSEAELAAAVGLSVDDVRSAEAGGFIDDLKTVVALTRFFELQGFECIGGPSGCGMIFRGAGRVCVTEPRKMVEKLARALRVADRKGFGAAE